MIFRQLTEVIQFFWMFENHHHQRLAWKDAKQARLARDRAEAQSLAQFHDMLQAHPSGALGDSNLNDADALKQAGLL
jgi:hypothetical protein